MWRHSIAPGALALLITSLASAADYEHYVIKNIEIVDLGTLGGDESVANDINDLGEVVGWSYDSIDKKRAFIDRGDGIQALMPAMQPEYVANGINNHTHVVGEFIDHNGRNGFEPGSAFYWEPEIFLVFLDAVEPNLKEVCKGDGGQVGANAKAINDAGVIVGYRSVTCPGAYIEKAARWETYASPWQELEASPLDLFLVEDHWANDINSSGRIVGWDNGNSGKFLKFGLSKVTGAWTWMGTPYDVPHPVTNPPAWYEPNTQQAFGVNDGSRVVGRATLHPQGENTSESVTRAYWWSGVLQWPAEQLPIFADTQNSAAYEINNQEFIVGYADRQTATFLPRQKRAVVWHTDFGIAQLPVLPGGTLVSSKDCEALAVNKRNASGVVQAVGYCRLSGKRHAVRWDILTAHVTIAP